MIPGSLDDGEPLRLREQFSALRTQVRRYFWLWIACQTLKGIVTTTFIWVPMAYLYLAR
ncbi:MAG: hypothetical protein KF723_14195 [Rhizobiaceae bacterium]|nr:hypothetical protein [Rhizobiaceae bacterium]